MNATKIILLTFVLFSCSLDSDFDFTSKEDLLVVNCILSPEKPISLHITKSNPYPNHKDSFETVTNAEITLFEDGILLDNLNYDDTKYHYEMDYYPKAGNHYRIQIIIQNYDTLSASTYIPEEFNARACYYFNQQTTSKINLSELQNSESYWIHFISKIWYTDLRADSSYFIEQDIRSPISASKIFDDFNGSHFNGKTEYFRYLRINQTEDIFFEVTSLESPFWFQKSRIDNLKDEEYLDMVVFKASPEMDKYWKAILVNYENSNFSEPNPFFEPISPYSNIENGTGIFAGINTKRISLIENNCN